MQQRPIGTSGLSASVLGFGCAPVGSRASTGESRRALRLAFENGVTYFDTADMYGVGASEQILGKTFASERDRIVISSKCGYTFSTRLKAVRFIKPLLRPLVTRLKGAKAAAGAVMASQRSQNFDPAYITACVEGSLRRLGTDRIDLFFLHDPPLAAAMNPAVYDALRALKQSGKIRHYGVSCDVPVAAEVLRAGSTGISAVQVTVNLIEQEALRTVLPLAQQQGVGVIARQPFANGRLVSDPRVASALSSRGLSTEHGAVSALAIRFLLDQPGIASILPSMMKRPHLLANVGAAGGSPLSEAERAAAADLASPAPAELR